MKIWIRSSEESKKLSPKEYIKQIAAEIGYRIPAFTDPAAGGYKMSYQSHTREEAESDLKKMTDAAKKRGINVIRPQVKSGNKGIWIAYMVVPRYEG